MAEIGQDMTRTDGLEGNSRLLEQLTTMASRLEADAASSAYRFGAAAPITTSSGSVLR